MFQNYLLSFFFILCSISYSQNEVDALRYSLFDNYTTARTTALGGAFNSLGGNMGAIQTNPATLGIYRTDEVSISLINTNESIESTYFNEINTMDRYELDLQNFGYVKSMPIENDWNRINMAISFNQRTDLNRTIKINGYNSQSSMSNIFLNNAQGLTEDELNQFSDYLAYSTFLIDTVQDVYSYESALNTIGQNQYMNITESGHINDIDISVSGAYKDFFFIGASIGFSEIAFSQHNEYVEDSFNNNENDYEWGNIELLNYNQNLYVTGEGVNFKMGAIIKPTYFVRLGWAYHSKTYHSLEETYETNMQTVFLNNEIEDRWTATSPLNYFNYQLNTPSKSITSLSLMLLKYGFITLDYETINYANSSLNSSIYNFHEENNNISNFYRKTNNIKIGAELKLNKIAVRGGYAIFGSPFKDDLNDGEKTYISGGIGFQQGQYFFDIAVISSLSEEDYITYPDPNIGGQSANLTTKDQSIIISCSYKF